MAYSSRFNPDALPAHAEPNEAAQIIANAQASKTKTSPQNKPLSSPNLKPTSYSNKPQPPLPNLGQDGGASQQPFRPQSTSVSAQGAPQRVSPGNPNSPWPAPLNTGGHGHIPGAYPPSAHTPNPSQSSQPPPPAGHRPHSPLPPAGSSDPSLFPLFMTVDVHRTGQLSQAELSSALKNDEYTSFDPETVRMMIKMFDGNGNGTIGYDEFCGLWGFLGAWRGLFQRFDEDRSGFISFQEYTNALTAFGYSLSQGFVAMMYGMYDRRGGERMTFDLFVQSCIQLKRMTDVFKRYDTDRDGFITLSFEDFLTETLNTR